MFKVDYSFEYKKMLGKYLGIEPSQIFLFWKGRVALYAILKSMGIKKDDEIIIPAFTCIVVPNVIKYLGAKPIYVDIEPKTFNIDVNKIQQKITSKTKVILAQNTFGLSSNIDAIIDIANKNKLIVIEDCTHGFGGTYKNKLNGTIADASFFSTQWNKPYSTGIGGIAIVKNPLLASKVLELETHACTPNWKEKLILSMMIFVRKYFMIPFIYWPALNFYRWLSQNNLIIGSSSKQELEGINMPKNFMKKMSSIQTKMGIEQLQLLDNLNLQRIQIAHKYDQFLSKYKIKAVFQNQNSIHTFLKYPLLVNNREEFLKLAKKNNIEIGEWFLSPIHPVISNFEIWDYHWGDNPIAEKLSQQIINLPTDLDANSKKFKEIIKFLETNSEFFIV